MKKRINHKTVEKLAQDKGLILQSLAGNYYVAMPQGKGERRLTVNQSLRECFNFILNY